MIAVVDVGGTKVALALAREGALDRVQRHPTPSDAPLAWLTARLDSVLQGAAAAAIALSVPGPFARASGSLLAPPGLPRAWHGLALAETIGEHYGCPVVLENDANCAALAEARLGAGRRHRSIVYFTVSTGVGTGVVRDGEILASRHDTEGGHQVLWPSWAGGPACSCGGAGCLEALASGRAIAARFGSRGESLEDQAAWDDVGRWLGLGVVNATTLLDPDAVIFGGGVTRSWARFEASLLATVRAHLRLQPLPEIRLGSLGEERNLLGAMLLAPPGSG